MLRGVSAGEAECATGEVGGVVSLIKSSKCSSVRNRAIAVVVAVDAEEHSRKISIREHGFHAGMRGFINLL